MEHRQRAHQQNEVNNQSKIRDETWDFVVDGYAHQRDDQSDQAGENARANRIQSESGRNAALFLDAHRRLQGVLKDARQPARFFLRESSCDLRVATVNRILDYRRRLDDPIKHNRKAMMNMRGSDVAELLGTIRIEPQMNHPALLFIRSASARNAIAGQVCFLFYQNPFFDQFYFFTLTFL